MIFDKSIESSNKRLKLSEDGSIGEVLRDELLKDALIGAISSFDSLGKALRNKHISKFPTNPRNLFQNFIELDKALYNSFGKHIKDYLSQSDSDFLFKIFQVRHIYEHNAGVIDEDFVNKLPHFKSQKGKKYKLEKSELELFFNKLLELVSKIYHELE